MLNLYEASDVTGRRNNLRNGLQGMTGLQEGIYYRHSENPRSSFALVFLRAKKSNQASKVQETLSKLWLRYLELKKKTVQTSRTKSGQDRPGSFSILIGYGPRFFEIPGIEKKKPALLDDRWLFGSPSYPHAPILPETGLKYGEGIMQNEVAYDHLIIQFISDEQAMTHRAIVETWKVLGSSSESEASSALFMRSFCTGFSHSDGRGWLGFHDGISNIRSSERLRAIQVDKSKLTPDDFWTAGGTYMAFIKIDIDLPIWESISQEDQEKIIGRQKTTGCPLVSVDQEGNNSFARGCPSPGTRQVIEKGNDQFREYFPLNGRRGTIVGTRSAYEHGHVQQMRKTPSKIFRQGYEYLEPAEKYPYFQTGLHFISFQSGPEQIHDAIKYGFGKFNFGGPRIAGVDKLLSVQAAGIFLVPPMQRTQKFPGDMAFSKSPGVSYARRF